ncbi:MAG: hypothetical protein ACKN9T_18695 [Candidatus Methylumidiphilus sp.]
MNCLRSTKRPRYNNLKQDDIVNYKQEHTMDLPSSIQALLQASKHESESFSSYSTPLKIELFRKRIFLYEKLIDIIRNQFSGYALEKTPSITKIILISITCNDKE